MNNKIVAGIVFGLLLGAIDGATAWFTPDARSGLGGIMVGSSFKGMIVGLLSGWFARKVHSVKWGIVTGAVLGLFFATLIAILNAAAGKPHYFAIMLPGFVTGAIIGFLTQTSGNRTAPRNTRSVS